MSDELSPRARAILDAAERLAAGEAPAPAAADAQLAALAEQVRLTVEAVRARLDELTARVDALVAQLAAQAPPPAPAPPLEDAPRLLAVELAVAGATRADVDARLRERFGLPWGGGSTA